jgi:hypothetical protein
MVVGSIISLSTNLPIVFNEVSLLPVDKKEEEVVGVICDAYM